MLVLNIFIYMERKYGTANDIVLELLVFYDICMM